MNQKETIGSILDSIHKFLPLSAEELSAPEHQKQARAIFKTFLSLLEQGHLRAVEQRGPQSYTVNSIVKQGILMGFRLGKLVEMGDSSLPFTDKDTFPVRGFSLHEKIRVVPGGTSVRRGSYVGPGVTLMPPSYINTGAFIDESSMIDSHALVGSCAQVGKRVHLSAAAQLGGVLEPIGALPVIVEDDAMIGGNCGVYEGTIVGARAVLAAGVVVTRSTRIYDTVFEREITAPKDGPLVIPPDAVVVPGCRPLQGAYAMRNHLQIATPIIIKYRDAQTDAKTALESALR
jgi:2,3,4,5-tetrahydropyridine-2-carboxylate N-succinyltransferase